MNGPIQTANSQNNANRFVKYFSLTVTLINLTYKMVNKQSMTDMNRSHIELVQTLVSDKTHVSQATEKIWSRV